MKNILFAVSETVPFVKTGGLADVAGSLPSAINKQGGNTRVILPKYGVIPEELMQNYRHITDFRVAVGWRWQFCALGEVIYEGIHYYFIDNEYYFKRDDLYGHFDDAERFSFFARAVLESLKWMENFKPDIIHCHDWHTGLIPMYLNEFYREDPNYFDIKTIFTIHNIRHQGRFPTSIYNDIIGIDERDPAANKIEFDGAINFMKGALLYSDLITTVSPSYAEEIQYPYFGEGLDNILRQEKDKLVGIINGIDYKVFNPLTDENIFVKYRSSLEKKNMNKLALQALLGLPEREDVPLISLVTRLDEQKGIDLINYIMDDLMKEDIQFVVLGTGEKSYEDSFYYFASKYPEKISAQILFDSSLAHKIYASSDILLMPSKFEPCGLAQMIAMKYGTVPLVRETGGLKDTVIPYNEHTGEGNGFSFSNYNAHELLSVLKYSTHIFYDRKDEWKNIVRNGIKTDFSWDNSAMKYMEIYNNI